MADFAENRSLDPTKTIPTGYSGGTPMLAIYDQLLRYNQETGEFVPRLAESIESNDDYTEWTLTLRPDVQFSDGTALNADAVIGSFNYYLQNRGYDAGTVGPLWNGATKVDDHTVTISLKQSWATFPFVLARGFGMIVAPAAIANGPDGFKPIGAGGFTFETYQPQEELVLAASETHWDGRPHLDKLRFVWLGADQTKYDSLTNGSVDAAVILDVMLIKQHREAGGAGWVKNNNAGYIISVNHADGRPGGNVKVRQAITRAIDEVGLYDRVFDGVGMPTKHLFGPTSQWYAEDIEAPSYDLALATQLLEEAKAEGFNGTVVLTGSQDPIAREQALTIEAMLQAAGFTVEHDFGRTPADLTKKVFIERNFDFARTSIQVVDEDPFWRLHANTYSGVPSNGMSYADPEWDALIDELRANEGEDRRDVLRRIEERYVEQLPFISLAASPTVTAWSSKVYGVTPSTDSLVGYENAWIAN